MEFLVLGPLEVWRDGQPIEVRGSKRRALLALLILHANEVVRSDRLVDELWGERSPGNASAALQNHISRLRKDLGGDILITKPWGYVVRADPQSIDLQRFEALLAESRTLPAHQRRERLQEALALWRGPALADVASEPGDRGRAARGAQALGARAADRRRSGARRRSPRRGACGPSRGRANSGTGRCGRPTGSCCSTRPARAISSPSSSFRPPERSQGGARFVVCLQNEQLPGSATHRDQ